MAYTTINKSTDYFNTKLYTGNATTNHAQTGIGFQPDWLWIKERGGTSSHILVDAVRGVSSSSTPFIKTNSSGAEVTNNVNDFIKSLDSDGFTLGADSYFTDVNKNSSTYASWNWKANGTGSANTDGSISSTVSANTTSGFSIVKYTATGSNATVGHGLGVAPAMVILKNLDSARSWTVGHNGLTNWNYHCYLSSTNAENSDSTMFQGTAPTNTVFSVGTASETNESGDNFIAYCFAEKQGYSKFGSYIGNGNADGTFIYTGFKPAWVMYKKTDTADYWNIHDTTRDTGNISGRILSPNGSDAEVDTGRIDILSNGFKQRTDNGVNNGSGGSYIYMAFAEAPLVGSNNVPATAR